MNKMIKSIGYDSKTWILIDEVTQISVKQGDVLKSFRGEPAKIVGGTAPHKPSSTGRVTTSEGAEFGPSVFGCRWIKA